jgi:hypothetical protein
MNYPKAIFRFLIIPISIGLVSLTESETKQIRDSYRKALVSESDIPAFKSVTVKFKNTALGKAYHGTALAFEARAAWSPSTKLSHAKSALTALNEAVKWDPKNVEIRFLRLSFAHGTPDFLSMKGSIPEDKKLILQSSIKDHPIGDVMQKFIRSSGLFSKEEITLTK